MTQVNVDPVILDNLSSRKVMPKEQFLTLPDELRVRAFTIARQTEANVLQATLDALHDTVATGGTLWNFRENFPQIAAPYTEAGRDWHLNLVFQQNVRQARAVGAYQARQRVKTAFPYVEYVTGPNPRPAHLALNRKIFAIDDPFLLSHTPPWEFNCNCDLIPRTAAQVGKIAEQDAAQPPEEHRVVPASEPLQRMIKSNQLPDPTRGAIHPVNVSTPSERGGEYSFRPDRLNQPVDLSGYDAEIRQQLVNQLREVGYVLSEDGTKAIPAGSSAPPAPPSAPSPPSAHKHVGRPAAPRVSISAARAGFGGASPLGRPMGRVSRPGPQIASRVGRPRTTLKEAA